MELALFALLALVAIVSAAAMIYSRNSIHSALFLILNFGCVALLFLMLDAPFISMVQIAVYAGAIMVLFLFVIMLLGAEQTTDTETRRLGWVWWVASGLAFLLLAAFGVGLLRTGSLDLPESAGEDPRLRLVHAANAPLLTVQIDEEAPVTDLSFGEASEFITLPVGEHRVLLIDENGLETALVYGLEPNEILTVVVAGDASESLRGIEVHNSFANSGDDEARVLFLNLFTQEPITLVDLGSDRVVSLSADGKTLLDRPVVNANFPYEEVVAVDTAGNTILLPEGEYSYGFYHQLPDGSWDEVVALQNPETRNWPLKAGTEQLVILVPDYNSVNDPNFGYRPMILDNLQEELTIETADAFGSPADIGKSLFTTYLLPVNVVGFLLLVALVGVIVLTRPEMLAAPRRSSINRRRKVSRPLVNVISQQTGQDVLADTPKLEDPSSGD
jgi:NADH:ubiquinone oxidoreductase subunit 6 (subunit J)